MTTYSEVGRPVTREDGPDKVSGSHIYPADVILPGMIWGKVLRSPYPHAKILNIDTSRAERLTGVRAVVTGRDTKGMRVGRYLQDVPPLAEDRVRFVGEKVAAVAADDPDTAEEALNLIDVEYEPLPAVFDPLEAMQPGAPLVHEGPLSYDSPAGPVQPQGNIVYHNTWSGGNLEQGFQESDLIFEHTFTTPWVHQGYVEPYSCIVDVDGSGQIQVWANNKQPFRLRWQLAGALGLPEERIRVNPCGIGGDFGGKAGAMNVPVAYVLAQRSGRPVQMTMSYIEELMAGNPRHPSVVTIKTGMKKDGRFWAREARVVYNGGAYGGFRGSLNLSGARQSGGGPYRVPNFQIDSYMVYTNNVPCGSYRAPGEPQAVFAIESHIDMIAREMGIDPYEMRLRNVVQEGDVSGTGQAFSHLRGEETLRRAADSAGWSEPKAGVHTGRGIALGQRPQGQAVFTVKVGMDENGRATIYTSVPDTGVGFYTVARQVVAEDLGLTAEDVAISRVDTDQVSFDSGAGAGTSVGAAQAALGAAQEVRQNLTGLAAEFYGWAEERIVFRQGRVYPQGDPEQGVPISELAARSVGAVGGPIMGEMTTEAKEPGVTSFCAQVADVEVDPETGQIKVRRIVTAHDVGTIFNPLGHQGQIDGAVIQGLGYALMEELQSEEGRISTLSLGDVKIPATQDIPELVTVLVEHPEGNGPYQGKAIGENPISPVAPAIANAVYDAVGVRITDLPITAEKVLAALQRAKK
ncbi:MAG: xanthine dehydrogenase family protein molybdopterin-binding subunit [Chloroflexi bacterium]|nr:xanthine dehydrogenase family protein molybdopterin-binding subunit [Chloroflexota bacterium]MCI0824371.1 xanthine dehydrogenase family protein molybdopterin-binding subunit [Chloroflexota bacterium]MCI0895611.1 xanthine dehydrogenase family protein molybdopterin-binding subunit [Chloroflexota bacterium]